jgi:membrane protein implicated in regulation of membrane protease activity
MNNETPNPEPKPESTTPQFETPKPESQEPEVIEPTHQSESQVISESPTKALVYPCCCGANQETFFYVFTILMAIDQSFTVLRLLVSVFVTGSGQVVFAFLIAGAFLGWIIKVLIDYKKDGNYGTPYAYFLSIVALVMSCIWLGALVLICLLFCIIGGTALSFISENYDIAGFAFGIIIAALMFGIILMAYVVYLLYLYYTVVKNKKEEMESKSVEEGEEEEGEKVEESVAQTQKSQLDEAKNMEANLV